MSKTKSRWLQYGGAAVFVILVGCGYLYSHDFATEDLKDQLRYLCDAFAVPGVLLIMVGLLIWVSNMGGFDGIGYSMKNLVRSLTPGGRIKDPEKYFDYVEKRREKRVRGYGFLFVSGAVSTVIGILFLALYYAM